MSTFLTEIKNYVAEDLKSKRCNWEIIKYEDGIQFQSQRLDKREFKFRHKIILRYIALFVVQYILYYYLLSLFKSLLVILAI